MNPHIRTMTTGTAATLNGRIVALNVLMLVMTLSLLVAVVVLANQFAGAQVAITDAQGLLRDLREDQHRAAAARAEREHPSRIEAFAEARGMVTAKDVSYVAIDGTDVAGR